MESSKRSFEVVLVSYFVFTFPLHSSIIHLNRNSIKVELDNDIKDKWNASINIFQNKNNSERI